jgi:hypothetical protein
MLQDWNEDARNSLPARLSAKAWDCLKRLPSFSAFQVSSLVADRRTEQAELASCSPLRMKGPIAKPRLSPQLPNSPGTDRELVQFPPSHDHHRAKELCLSHHQQD